MEIPSQSFSDLLISDTAIPCLKVTDVYGNRIRRSSEDPASASSFRHAAVAHHVVDPAVKNGKIEFHTGQSQMIIRPIRDAQSDAVSKLTG